MVDIRVYFSFKDKFSIMIDMYVCSDQSFCSLNVHAMCIEIIQSLIVEGWQEELKSVQVESEGAWLCV